MDDFQTDFEELDDTPNNETNEPNLSDKPKRNNYFASFAVGAVLLFAVSAMVYYWRYVKPPRAKMHTEGLLIDTAQYNKIPKFVPIDSTMLRLPLAFSLEQYCPRRGVQGDQNSCVGWSLAYAARTILEAQQTGANPNAVRFSPSFLYNQIHRPDCEGAMMLDAFRAVTNDGLLSLDEFPYSESNCDRLPTPEQKLRAAQYKINDYTRLSQSGSQNKIDFQGIKQTLVQGAPVIIGAMITTTFDTLKHKVWLPPNDTTDEVLGGHAMCVVGYNDTLAGGALQIMNSWGEQWGERGFAWVRYADFTKFCKEAYGIAPLPRKDAENDLRLQLKLLDSRRRSVLLPYNTKNQTATLRQANPRNRYSLELTNQTSCYTYIYGVNRRGAVRKLFPPDAQTSAYLGITGTRRLPVLPVAARNYTQVAVITTLRPLDSVAQSKVLKRLPQTPLSLRLRRALILKSDSSTLLPMQLLRKANTLSLQSKKAKQPLTFVVLNLQPPRPTIKKGRKRFTNR